MNGTEIAWLVIGASGCLGAAVLYYLLRGLKRQGLRLLLVALTLTLFLVPAPVPAHPEQLAPAFVVAIFEAFFQIDGAPEVSLRILVIALTLVTLLTLVGRYFFSRYYKRAPRTAD